MFTHEYFADHEKCYIFNDLGGRLQGFIAIHSTALGPTLGGCRFWHYDSPNKALSDALRLSEGMSYKNAMANLPLGGGKSVIMANNFDGRDRKELFECFGLHVNELAGQYYTAIDVGTTLEDMKAIRTTTPYVCGVKNPIDGTTAQGAFNAILGVIEHGGMVDRKDEISVAIQGVGKTGYGLAKLLHEYGIGELIVADVVQDNVDRAVIDFGARAVSTSQILYEKCDILAPCALGGVITYPVVNQLGCSVICGIANNQLADEGIANALESQDILYVPDFIVNAGGVIAAAQDVTGKDHTVEIDNIKDRVLELLREARTTNRPPLEIAMEQARSMIC